MQPPPISRAEIEARLAPHLHELLALWWAEQGASKPRDLALIAAALSLPPDQPVRVLDLCCGPGDVGRAIREQYRKAEIDGVDRDPFLASLCAAVNRRDLVPGRIVVADLKEPGWRDDLSSAYDAVATVNALHWFEIPSAVRLLREVRALLRPGGVFILAEPVASEAPFAAGVAAWTSRQPPRYARAAWEQFWSRANEVLGYDHLSLLGPRPTDNIGDGLTTLGWTRLLRDAGFDLTDVLLRDADQVIIAALESG